MGDWGEEMDSPHPHSLLLSSVCPFPRPSLPFDECDWIFDFPTKEETVLQSNSTCILAPSQLRAN